MAELGKELGYAKLRDVVISAKQLISRMDDNSKWEDTFENGLAEYKNTHTPIECKAFEVAIRSHTFWEFGNEISAIPISTEKLIKEVGNYDSGSKIIPIKVVHSYF